MKKYFLHLSLVSCLIIKGAFHMNAQDTVALWSFESLAVSVSAGATAGSYTPESGSGNFWSIRNPANGGTFINQRTPGNGSTYALRTSNWQTVGYDCFLIKVSTTGLYNVTVNYDQQAVSVGNTGAAVTSSPADYKIQFSTDSVTFIDLPGGAYTLPGTTAWQSSVPRDPSFLRTYSMPPTVNDQSSVYIKIVLNATTTTAGTEVTAASSSFIDNILVTASSIPLSVDLLNISARNEGEVNVIDWGTSREDEGDYFVLQRSSDGKSFSSIATLQGKAAAGHYRYIDETPLQGTNFYRLVLSSADHTEQYSKVVTARRMNSGEGINIYPNPVDNILHITSAENTDIVILRMDGSKIKEVKNTNQVNVSDLSAGTYLIQVYHISDNTLIHSVPFSKL